MTNPGFKNTNNKYIEVKESAIHHRGAFAKQDIPKGTHIIEYVGELIEHEEAEKRERENDKKGSTYIYILDDTHCIDGAFGGNESICINHSCNPNCEDVMIGKKIWIFALHDIKKGEELTFDYSFPHDGHVKTPCHCKSHNCRGHIEDTQQ